MPLLFTKKGFVTPYHKIATDTMTFLDILFVEQSKFSSGISDIFLLPYTQLFCRLTGTSRVKSFSSCQTVFSIIQMLFSNLASEGSSSFSSSFTHLWCFQVLELFKVSFFHHSPYWWPNRFVQQFFLVLNTHGATLPVRKPALLSNVCFLP